MRKVFKMEELDCAHCAAKMEDGIRKLDGVEKATVNFLSQKMILEIAEGTDLDSLMQQVSAVCKKVDPDSSVIF